MSGTQSAVRTKGRVAYSANLNAQEPAHLAWVVDLILRFVDAHRGRGRSECDASGLGRAYRPRQRGDEARQPQRVRMADADLLAVSRAWGKLPRTPWPWGQILRCAYLPGHPRPDVACRLMHIAPTSWVRERDQALLLLAEILRRDAPRLVPPETQL